jgi:hypothetical protein
MVDPKKDGGGGGPRPGWHTCAGVGFRRWKASTGTPMITMGFVILMGDDRGKRFMRAFPNTANAIGFIADWAKASGHLEPFNTDNDDTISKIMARGAVQANLEEETYKGKTRVRPSEWKPFKGTEDPAWTGMISKGEEDFAKKSRELEDEYGGGGGGNQNSGHPNAPDNDNGGGGGNGGGPPDDDIPF